MSEFIVPWKREGTTNLKYTFKKNDIPSNPHIACVVTFNKKGKEQSMVAFVILKDSKPVQYNNALNLIGKSYSELPSLNT